MSDQFVLQRLQELADSGGVEIIISSFPWGDRPFTCQITSKADGVELKVSAVSTSVVEAIRDALAKHHRVVGKGIPEMQAKVLEHRPIVVNDEDIPF